MSQLDVVHQRLAGNEKLVRHHIPWPNHQLALVDQAFNILATLWPDLDKVIEHDRQAWWPDASGAWVL